jgi:hypothetical protein
MFSSVMDTMNVRTIGITQNRAKKRMMKPMSAFATEILFFSRIIGMTSII